MAHVHGNNSTVRIYPRRKAGAGGAAPARGRAAMQLSRSALAAWFSIPQAEAAQGLGISLTALKAVCRKLGISRWPFVRRKKALASPKTPFPAECQPPRVFLPAEGLHGSGSDNGSLSRVATLSGLSIPELSHACEWGDSSMHANGGDASVSSRRASDGNSIEAGCGLGDDLSWMLWDDPDCLDSSEDTWWERFYRSYDECAGRALAYQGLGGNFGY